MRDCGAGGAPTGHVRDEWYQPPTPDQALAYANAKGVDGDWAMKSLREMREKALARTKEDPFRFGFEPPVWFVAKALMRGYRPTARDEKQVRRRAGCGWEEFAARMRAACGFAAPVAQMVIMGANRSGKTDFAAKTAVQDALREGACVAIGAQKHSTAVEVQHARVWRYLPPELREKNVARRRATDVTENISYTEKNGFAGSKIVLANRSLVKFITYEMDVAATLEGMEYDKVWLDEEFNNAYMDAAIGRIASKSGTFLGTFTPVSGYSPVVAAFLEGMQVTRWHTAYLLPKDGGEPLPWTELGLSRDEYETLGAWRRDGGEDPGIPECRPEDCFEWMEDGGDEDLNGLNGTKALNGLEGRAFAKVPRVAVCKGGEAAAIWFYCADNPYGRPMEIIRHQMANRNAVGMIRKRVYGVAEKVRGRMFMEFSKEKHVIPDAAIPKRLVRCMVVDPAPERNWTAGWYGYDPQTEILYKYRDWPGSYEIPTVGVPGDWAVPSDRRGGMNDGDRGEAQESFGMGFLHYKFEWARLEGWAAYKNWLAAGGDPSSWPEEMAEIEEWSELDGTDEPMQFRLIDSRAASQSKISMKENVSLFDEVAKLAEGFQPASGQRIDIGINFLRDRIVAGKYLIAASCKNTIFAYETYTGLDGQKGACKDFVDCDRYCVLSELCSCRVDDLPPEAGQQAVPAANIGAGGLSRRKARRGAGGRRL